ncbi:desert hedgehog protein-like isoform X2 [Paramacrobiotus metropolitanus]|nr:desert hedgehog protein-like isoform X2 [Paramacrobiotus metropolitanus]
MCSESCGPGKTELKRRRVPKKFQHSQHWPPFVKGQYEPPFAETAWKASGPARGRIARKSQHFREELVRVTHPDILFRRDRFSSSTDRFMTRTCKEKLEILSIMVQNRWPGVKLMVTAGHMEYVDWTSMNAARYKRHLKNRKGPPKKAGVAFHSLNNRRQSAVEAWHPVTSKDTLHYEGRAVDIRTSDRDRTKYGMLARLAVQSGFNWVHYESLAHVHCSCRSEYHAYELMTKLKGCFHANSSKVVRKKTFNQPNPETIAIRNLRIGDYVLSTDGDGELVYSQVIAWLDRDFSSRNLFYRVTVANGQTILVTPSHLIMSKNPQTGDISSHYADDLSVGDILLSTELDQNSTLANMSDLGEQRITSITEKILTGSVAPLTVEGTIVVNGLAASCYASIQDAGLAHAAFAPLRWWVNAFGLPKPSSAVREKDGVHPFAKFLYGVAGRILPQGYMFSDSILS